LLRSKQADAISSALLASKKAFAWPSTTPLEQHRLLSLILIVDFHADVTGRQE
jgi:hypothetical protein